MGATDGAPKEIRRLIKDCVDEGLDVTFGHGGHYKVKGKGWVVTISQTPKNAHTAVKAAKRDLRRNGVIL